MVSKSPKNDRFALVTRNLQEVIGTDELQKKLAGKKPVSIYWGTMPTGSISIAYFFPMLKIADFLKAGLAVKILIADLHAALDGVSWDILNARAEYYEYAIRLILKRIGVDAKKLTFVRGSSFQLTKEYSMDLLKLSTLATINESRHAAAEAVKTAQGDSVKLSGLIYPLMQALDEEYLHVDAQLGGADQRKILVFAREFLPKIGYSPRIELMNPMIRGLVGVQMSSSNASSKIDLLDDVESIKSRINKADCVQGDPNNGICALAQYLLFAIFDTLTISRPEKYGGNKTYTSYESLENDFVAKKLHPQDLKNAVADGIIKLLDPLTSDPKMYALHRRAYG